MEVTFLGTSTMMPTKERNNTAVFVSIKGKGVLIDCAEGTQRQFKLAGISPNKIDIILISHWHGDHTLGLSGLVQTLGMQNYNKKLKIYGPKDSKKYFEACMNSSIHNNELEVEVIEVEQGIIYKDSDIEIETLPLDHPVPCQGFSILEKGHRKFDLEKMKDIPKGELWSKLQKGESIKVGGTQITPEDVTYLTDDKKLAYILDTVYTSNCVTLAQNADAVISECTYDEDLDEKADEHGHMTVKDATRIANEANAKLLLLTHFSARYKDTEQIKKSAKKYFENVECAHDFFNIKI